MSFLHAWGFWSNFCYGRIPLLIPTLLFFLDLGLAQWCAGLHTLRQDFSDDVLSLKSPSEVIGSDRHVHVETSSPAGLNDRCLDFFYNFVLLAILCAIVTSNLVFAARRSNSFLCGNCHRTGVRRAETLLEQVE